jgi:cobalamin biosynthesis Mg chelatase CobN
VLALIQVGVTHYFKPDKARTVLGYRPLVPPKEGMRRVVAHFVQQPSSSDASQSSLSNIVVLLLVAVLSGAVYWYLL